MRLPLLLVAAGLALAACKKEQSTDVPWTRAWNMSVGADNFRVNATRIVLTTGSGTVSRLTTAIPAASVPDPIRTLDIEIYVPTELGHTTTLGDLSATVRRADGTRTGNVLNATGTGYRDYTMIGGRRYGIFRLAADLGVDGTLARSEFAIVSFGFRVTYEDPTGDVANTRAVTVEVEKQ